MAIGGSYTIVDATESYEFPAPVTSWTNQQLGTGLSGIPNLNAYRIHVWRFVGLPEEIQAKLTAFQTRQQSNGVQPVSIETDPYDPLDDCDERRRTEMYTDAIITGITRERGYGVHQTIIATFEVLVS